MSLIVLVIVLQILLFRSRWGLRTRAVGEHPKAAETVGIDVIRLRYRNVILGGVFAGLAGAYLSIELSNSFQAGMTAGRGFIAPGRDDLRPLDAARRVRRGAPVRPSSQSMQPGDPLLAAGGRPRGDHLDDPGRRSSACCRTSSRSSSWPASSAGASRRPPTAARTSARRRLSEPDETEPSRRIGPRRAARAAERERADDRFLDLHGGPRAGPGPRRRGIARVLRAARRIAVIGASSSRAGRRSACSATWSGRATSACRSTRTSARSSASRRFRDLARGGRRRPARSTSSTSSAAPSCACPHAEEAVAAGARCLWLQLGVVNWEAARIAAAGGLSVVMDRCTAIEWRRMRREAGAGRAQRMQEARRTTRTKPDDRDRARADLGLAAQHLPSRPTAPVVRRRRGGRRATTRSARRSRPAP